MTRSTSPDKAENYLRKADASLSMAKIAITKGAYDNGIIIRGDADEYQKVCYGQDRDYCQSKSPVRSPCAQ
jgi:hypothetical protein